MPSVLPDVNGLAVIVSTVVFAVLGGVLPRHRRQSSKVALGNETRVLPTPGPIFIVGPLVATSSPRF